MREVSFVKDAAVQITTTGSAITAVRNIERRFACISSVPHGVREIAGKPLAVALAPNQRACFRMIIQQLANDGLSQFHVRGHFRNSDCFGT